MDVDVECSLFINVLPKELIPYIMMMPIAD